MRTNTAMIAAMAALAAPVRMPAVFRLKTDSWSHITTCSAPGRPKFRGAAPEKYPGQRRAYLRGAWRPMTDREIREHNEAVDARKAEHREQP